MNNIYLQKFNCIECGIKFIQNCTLKRHLLKKHNIKKENPTEKIIKCLKCKKAFTQKKNMIWHMRMHSKKVDIPVHTHNNSEVIYTNNSLF